MIATFWERLLAAADDDKAKDCLCDDDGGNVDCHKIPLVSRFIVSFLPLSLDSIDFLLLCFEHLLLSSFYSSASCDLLTSCFYLSALLSI